MLKTLKLILPVRFRKIGKFLFLRTNELLGRKLSPSLNGLAEKMEAFFDPAAEVGFFIEVGGNDGITQSNTYHLERYHGWNGILIEPVGWLAAMSRRFRKARVFEMALGPRGCEGSTLTIAENDLMSQVVASELKPAGQRVTVPVVTLSSIIDETGVKRIDLLSLDVEGFEKEVLLGIDFNRHNIRRILVETKNNPKELPLPWDRYKEPVKLTYHDYFIEEKID